MTKETVFLFGLTIQVVGLALLVFAILNPDQIKTLLQAGLVCLFIALILFLVSVIFRHRDYSEQILRIQAFRAVEAVSQASAPIREVAHRGREKVKSKVKSLRPRSRSRDLERGSSSLRSSSKRRSSAPPRSRK
ncbi:TPA_asm: ORFX protein [Quercus robur waikavirus]|uniref:ORFX protein n=1 Tax=Quercus robur waikavirus TaxID=3027349 RepID=A0AA48P9N7_9SECO|nr:TPA_asm: ORFX protein [Quercus robur waikavirus]